MQKRNGETEGQLPFRSAYGVLHGTLLTPVDCTLPAESRLVTIAHLNSSVQILGRGLPALLLSLRMAFDGFAATRFEDRQIALALKGVNYWRTPCQARNG